MLTQQHNSDPDGNPCGGHTLGIGLYVTWQPGPLSKTGGQAGAFVEDLIEASIGRLEYYQKSKFASPYNEETLIHLRAALASQRARTTDRMKRGVEGTHEV